MAIDPTQVAQQAQAKADQAYQTFTGVSAWIADHPKATFWIGFAGLRFAPAPSSAGMTLVNSSLSIV